MVADGDYGRDVEVRTAGTGQCLKTCCDFIASIGATLRGLRAAWLRRTATAIARVAATARASVKGPRATLRMGTVWRSPVLAMKNDRKSSDAYSGVTTAQSASILKGSGRRW